MSLRLRHFRRDVLNRFLNLLDGRVDFANQIVLRFRQFLDPLGHVVQLLQHFFLPAGEPVHPPKTNRPASGPHPGENECSRHFSPEAEFKEDNIELIRIIRR